MLDFDKGQVNWIAAPSCPYVPFSRASPWLRPTALAAGIMLVSRSRRRRLWAPAAVRRHPLPDYRSAAGGEWEKSRQLGPSATSGRLARRGGRKAEAARRIHVPGPGGDRRYVPGEGCWQQTTSPIPRERPRLSIDGLRFHCWGIRHAGSTNAYRHLPPRRTDAESPSRRGTGPEPDVVHSQPPTHPRLTSIGRGL